MIREISKNDLTDDYFLLLSQLSGALTGYSVYNMWEAYLKGSSKTYIYINNDNQITGSATVFIEHKFLKCGSTVGHIEDVVVDRERRSKGTGKALVDKCVEFAKQQGCYKVILDCSRDNVAFYSKCGFRTDAYCMRIDTKE
jgi:glucosamine-phosphate N-acetyltransferase